MIQILSNVEVLITMLDVTFLAHSGFLVDDGKRCYVFDYYKDPNNIVWQLAKRGREDLAKMPILMM